jgi:hypothetical protein
MSGRSATPEEQTAAAVLPDQLQDQRANELIAYLEPDQLVVETFRPVPRALLTRNLAVALWGLRVFVVLVSLMVLYTFIAALH